MVLVADTHLAVVLKHLVPPKAGRDEPLGDVEHQQICFGLAQPVADHQSLEIVGDGLEAVELRHLPLARPHLQLLPLLVLPDSLQPLLLLNCLHLLCVLCQFFLHDRLAREEVDGEVDQVGAADALWQTGAEQTRISNIQAIVQLTRPR